MAKTSRQLARDIKAVLAKPARKTRGRAAPSERSLPAAPRPTPYRIKLSPSELDAVEFARGRYDWADMLAKHAAEDGSIAFTESDMWQWCDDVDADDAQFPLASPALAHKLESFYESRV
jgi:hypothetical protein